MSDARALIEQGNAAYVEKQYTAASILYGRALELTPDDALVLCNRSATLLAAGDPERALADAKRCTRIKPDWEKGWQRVDSATKRLVRRAMTATTHFLFSNFVAIVRSYNLEPS
jgi:tetratricopeptide (TPR) repeat protein